jgi:carbon storage regulator CsrA
MLVLSRKEGEKIVMPECGVTVTVLDITGKKVRLGVSAPTNVGIRRGELGWEQPDASFRCQEAAAAALEEPLMSICVLIADTDEYLLGTYREHLAQHGFDVITATGGVECVAKLRECVPDVLVLEPSIPWGGGDGVLAMMYEEPDVPLVPVIVLTYGRDRSALYRLAPFPVDDYQVKPLGAKGLAERIRAVARRRQLEDSPAEPAGRNVQSETPASATPAFRRY